MEPVLSIRKQRPNAPTLLSPVSLAHVYWESILFTSAVVCNQRGDGVITICVSRRSFRVLSYWVSVSRHDEATGTQS